MRELKMFPRGGKCEHCECPPGFFVYKGLLCLKTEYNRDQLPEPYKSSLYRTEAYNSGGEVFWGDVMSVLDREALIVQPVDYVWADVEE